MQHIDVERWIIGFADLTYNRQLNKVVIATS